MSKKKKFLFLSIVAVLVLAAGITGVLLNRAAKNGSTKAFTILIVSERDSLEKTLNCASSLSTLGEYLRTLPDCSGEESSYGFYVTGWYGCMQDTAAQYWWCISVDHKDSANGADQIPLETGHEYEFTLRQGW